MKDIQRFMSPRLLNNLGVFYIESAHGVFRTTFVEGTANMGIGYSTASGVSVKAKALDG